jgi:hypothetical protein
MPILGGSASVFPAFKVSVKNGLFLGEMTADAARDDFAKRAFVFYENIKHALTLTASMRG